MKLSKRGLALPASPIRKLIPFAEQAKKKGTHVYHLNIGQPDIETPQEFWNSIKNYSNKVLAYGNSQGIAEYLGKLTGYYKRCGLDIKEDEIIVTTGGSEAIIFAMTAICDPGDEIIIFEPFYTNYNGFAVQAGIKVVPITTHAENGFHLPPDEEIEKAITGKTRGIMYCNPNNPTGTIFTAEEINRLKNIVLRHDLFLLADEVYREYIYEGEYVSIMSLDGISDRAIMLDSISKRFSACGARVGNLVTKNRSVYTAALHMGQARLCSPTLEQVGAAAAYDLGDEYFSKMIDEYRRRRDVVYEGLMKIEGTVCINPGGAFYVMAKLPIDDAEEFAAFLLTDFEYNGKTVMVAPGPGFYATPGMGKNECRIAYVLNTDDLKDAMDLLKRGVEMYNKK
ncbi:MAG TPA: pyridoxal phosphate-dependent aminotransferase [candidate division Zixibacteria bacterium]|nr:pyridoxal phosphate-dependent aminotransferase [candidate division Zixibacteria bacterium]